VTDPPDMPADITHPALLAALSAARSGPRPSEAPDPALERLFERAERDEEQQRREDAEPAPPWPHEPLADAATTPRPLREAIVRRRAEASSLPLLFTLEGFLALSDEMARERGEDEADEPPPRAENDPGGPAPPLRVEASAAQRQATVIDLRARAARRAAAALIPLLAVAALVAWYLKRPDPGPPIHPDVYPLAACRDLPLPAPRPEASDPAERQHLGSAHARLVTEPAATLAQLDADQQRYGKDAVWEEREALAVRAMLCLHARGQVSLEDVAPRASALASGAAPDSPLRAAIAELAAEVSRKLKDEGLEEPSPEPSQTPPVAPSAPSSAPQQPPPPEPPRRVWRDGRLK
jgi:hypothetical protein